MGREVLSWVRTGAFGVRSGISQNLLPSIAKRWSNLDQALKDSPQEQLVAALGFGPSIGASSEYK